MDEENLKHEIKKSKVWVKDQKIADGFEVIRKGFHPLKDFTMDKGCYVLIRIYPEEKEIGLAVVNYDNVILKEFRGKLAQEIYIPLLTETNFITKLDHAAYIGKELARAEICLKEGKEYIQE